MFALASHQRAVVATDQLGEEIAPLPELDHDEGVRPDSAIETLSRSAHRGFALC